MAAGSAARVFAKAGGSSTIVSKRARSRSRALRYSNAFASMNSPFSSALRRKFSSARTTACSLASREVQREGAVIAEAGERATVCHTAGERAVLALVEKRARLLAPPRRCEIAYAVFIHLDLVGHRAGEQLDSRVESLFVAQGHVVPRENTRRLDELVQRGDDVRSESLEAGTHQLHDQPAVVSIDDERWDQVAFAMHEAIRIRGASELAAPCDGALECASPPRTINCRVGIAIEEAERDLGAR